MTSGVHPRNANSRRDNIPLVVAPVGLVDGNKAADWRVPGPEAVVGAVATRRASPGNCSSMAAGCRPC